MKKEIRHARTGVRVPRTRPPTWPSGIPSPFVIPHWLLALALFTAASGPMLGESALGDSEERIIHYEATEGLTDPVARLQKRLAEGTTRLKFEAQRGYLRSLLEALRIPVSSQGLVFSKTSSQ
ncbi:MAG TPA: hypothetical protein VEO53_05155, partial [Candidatus Binatia bacterium]|nr:hypothetical protein [Candidatus Binatia bacterium]